MRSIVCGQPHDYLVKTLKALERVPKQRQAVDPSRRSNEKQPNIINDLRLQMQETKFVVCQERPLPKTEYYQQLLPSKIGTSFALQETLGIAFCIELPVCGVVPFVPNRLSYAEIFANYPEFLYPSEWSESFQQYVLHRNDIINRLSEIFDSYDQLVPRLNHYVENVMPRYSSGATLVDNIISPG
jgi:hypothetical protein